MSGKLDIPLHGRAVDIVRRCGSSLSSIIESKFGCSATIDGVDFKRGPGAAGQTVVVPEERFSATMLYGIRLSVWKADLTTFKEAEAVVNAANVNLQHAGGLAAALSVAGGTRIQTDSNKYVSKNGPLKTGDAIVCDPGRLPYKKIIHAVGPNLSISHSSTDLKDAGRLLEKTINNVLQRVKENRLQSVAIPAVSSGLFNYPLPDCANTIVRTVKRFYESSRSTDHHPADVFLVNHDERTVKEMETTCRQVFPSSGNTRNAAQTRSNAKTRSGGKTSTIELQLGIVHLTLKKGNLEEQKADVIVNTTSSERDLSIGQISKALLNKAGRKMQMEIREVSPTGCIFITSGYNLPCNQVYHTVCLNKGKLNAQQILERSVRECLWMAATNHHNSIALPAIGTGALGFTKTEVARIMAEAVEDFAQKVPEKMDVYFVIYPSDDATFKAFEEELGRLKKTASPPSYNQALEYREQASSPRISLKSFSEEATREAERWLNNLLNRSNDIVTIRNNFVQYFGEQQYQHLSRLAGSSVSFEEFFENGRAGIVVLGNSAVDVTVAALQVEAMLCSIQSEFVMTEESAMIHAVMDSNVSYEQKTVDNYSQEFFDISSNFTKHPLRVVKVERVENATLKTLFDLKKKHVRVFSPPLRMFQRIPAQFCQMVSHIGFHAEFAPPDDSAYGEGIYFASDVRAALELWKEQMGQKEEEYVYFVEAEVLTGNSAPGHPGLILPPAVDGDPNVRFDSVSGGQDVSVIFSGYQALPRYIITCKMYG